MSAVVSSFDTGAGSKECGAILNIQVGSRDDAMGTRKTMHR